MHHPRPIVRGMLIAAALSLLAVAPSYAYVDPGSGSYLFQFLIAGLAGMAYAVKMFWNRIRPLFNFLPLFRKRD